MNVDKFKTLIDNFSPALLVETFQRSHDFFRIQQNLLPTFSDKQFTDFTQLGDFKLEDNTSIVVICARSLTHLNERASRKAQYDVSKKVLKGFQTSRAGIFVYYDSKGDFRMSLIYTDYVGIKTKFSTFRRFTYFVSKEQTNTTFFQQVAPFDFTNFQELKEVFSVEKVTKEFFKKYRDLFGDLLEDFDNNEVFKEVVIVAGITNTADFVKKLMGQIVFLYFVQKKGWLGVRPNENWGTGNQTFLRFLFSTCAKANRNYYNDYLEPLFYDALAEKRDKDYFELFNCRIPFLNGGLFESAYDWKDTKIDIPNKTTGKLLDFFDQYNFTVDENTPSDQEISIDPEMLGKIFENLLDVKDRKDKGSFYTPREIVHYMCRESLIQHLVSENTAPEERIRKLFEVKDTDLSLVVEDEKKIEMVKRLPELKEISEKVDLSLRRIKIVDPAVGSGAFPMGMLNEISSIRYYLNTNFLHTKKQGKELTLYDIKKETLENCIYAVDIDPGAVEIAKLRFWLALIVEYNADELENSPPTLPNLDYKIMQGNSLLEEYEGIKLFDEKLLQAHIINSELLDPKNQHISKLQAELLQFYMKNPNWMQKGVHSDKPREVIELEVRLRDFLKKNKNIEGGSVEQKDLFASPAESKMIWEEIKSNKALLFSESQKEKKKDLREQIEDLNWQLIKSTLKEQGKESEIAKIKQFWESNFRPFFLWRLHFSEVFEEKGGFDIVIGNPPYVQIQKFKGQKMQKNLEDQNYKTFRKTGDIYCLFYERGLNLAKINTGILCYITSNKWMRADYGEELRDFFVAHNPIILIDLGSNIFESAAVDSNILLIKNGKNEGKTITLTIKNSKEDLAMQISDSSTISNFNSSGIWFIGTPFELNLKRKLEIKGVPLKNLNVLINKGLMTGCNEAFYINENKKNELEQSDKKSSELIFKNFRGREICKYYTPNSEDSYVIVTSNYINIDNYPAIKKHLLEYETKLKARAQFIRGDHEWFTVDNCPSKENLKKYRGPKIIYPNMTQSLSFTIDYSGSFSNDKTFTIVADDILIKFLCAVLNSKLLNTYLKISLPKLGNDGYEVRKVFFENTPIPKIDTQNEKEVEIITKLVDHILLAKKENRDIEKLENEINQFVYQLYDLAPEEIKIIEDSSKK